MPPMDWPSSVIRPRPGASNPAIALSSVDLPAPFGPDDADDLAGVDAQVDALQDLVGGAVAGDDAFDAQEANGPPEPRLAALIAAGPCTPPAPRVGGQLGEAALGQVPAFGQHHDVVAEPRDRVHVMLDQQDGQALVDQAAQVLRDLAGQRRIDARDRLVEQDELRVRHQRAPDLQQLLLAARQARRGLVQHAHEVEPLARSRAPRRSAALPAALRASERRNAATTRSPGCRSP